MACIGGAVIVVQTADVTGLTAIASTWMMAAVGAASGAGLVAPFGIAAGLVLAANVPLQIMERRAGTREWTRL